MYTDDVAAFDGVGMLPVSDSSSDANHRTSGENGVRAILSRDCVAVSSDGRAFEIENASFRGAVAPMLVDGPYWHNQAFPACIEPAT